jgi:hypothetical protein
MADPHTRVYRKGVLEAEGFPDVDASRIAVPTLITGYYGMNAPYPDSAALRRHRVARAHRDDVRDARRPVPAKGLALSDDLTNFADLG